MRTLRPRGPGSGKAGREHMPGMGPVKLPKTMPARGMRLMKPRRPKIK
jgi:hypothetical protein